MEKPREWLYAMREKLSRHSPWAEKMLLWEKFLRDSLHGLYSEIAEHLWMIESFDYDWANLRDIPWLEEEGRTPEEIEAYVRGAIKFAQLMLRVFEGTTGVDIEDFMPALERRRNLEKELRDFLDGESRLPGAEFGRERAGELSSRSVLVEPQVGRRWASKHGDSDPE